MSPYRYILILSKRDKAPETYQEGGQNNGSYNQGGIDATMNAIAAMCDIAFIHKDRHGTF